MFPRRNPPRRNPGEGDERPQPSDSKEFEGKGRVMTAVKRMYDDFPSRVQGEAEWRKTFIRRPNHEYSEEHDFVHPCVPQLPTDESWSSDDEQQAQQLWSDQRELWELPSSLLPEYKGLWKLAIKFMRCTPWDIVGVRSRFEFTKASGHENKMWSSNFAKKLSCLIPHPVWTDLPYSSAGYLATALQYAIIFRTNDQNKWAIDPVNPFTKEFSQVIAASPGPWNVRKLHRETRTRCRSNNIALSQLSVVFKSLEVTVRIPNQPKEEETTVYHITTEDLGNLTKALDNMHDPRTGHSPMTTAVYYTTAITPRLVDDPPKNDSQVERWHELTMVDQFRARVLSGRAAPSVPPTERSPRPTGNMRATGSLSLGGRTPITYPVHDDSPPSSPIEGDSPRPLPEIRDSFDEDLYSASPGPPPARSPSPFFNENEDFVPAHSSSGSPMQIDGPEEVEDEDVKQEEGSHTWEPIRAHTSLAPDNHCTWTPRPFAISTTYAARKADIEQVRSMGVRVAGLFYK